jgi:hypothetical protein
MALVLGEQAFEFVEQLFGDVRRTPKLAKVRNDSTLRFNVALALCDVAQRHFQFGLAVHFETALHPKQRGSERCLRPHLLLDPQSLLRGGEHFPEASVLAY